VFVPEELEPVEIVSSKPKEEEPEFVELVGQISLKSLDRAAQKKEDNNKGLVLISLVVMEDLSNNARNSEAHNGVMPPEVEGRLAPHHADHAPLVDPDLPSKDQETKICYSSAPMAL
jgi:hypothetical protein